jgi:hypothetical protein
MSDPSASGLASSNATRDLSKILADAMNFVRSVEENNSISAITLDSLLNDYINSLKTGQTTTVVDDQGNTLYNRPSRYDQLTALQTSLNNAVSAIQAAGTDPAKLAALGMNPTVPVSSGTGT